MWTNSSQCRQAKCLPVTNNNTFPQALHLKAKRADHMLVCISSLYSLLQSLHTHTHTHTSLWGNVCMPDLCPHHKPVNSPTFKGSHHVYEEECSSRLPRELIKTVTSNFHVEWSWTLNHMKVHESRVKKGCFFEQKAALRLPSFAFLPYMRRSTGNAYSLRIFTFKSIF